MKENNQGHSLINLLGYPALLINRYGNVTAINKLFEKLFICRKDSCLCQLAQSEIIPQFDGSICSGFFITMMELIISFPTIKETTFHQNHMKWVLHCKNFDDDLFLVYATDDIDPTLLAQKLEVLEKHSPEKDINFFNLPSDRKNIIEISLSEFEKSLNKSFFLIQNNQMVYCNENFKRDFNIQSDTLDKDHLEKILGRSIEFFKTLCSSKYNHSPIEIDNPFGDQNKSYKIQGKEVIFNQDPAYALVLGIIEKPGETQRKIKSANINPQMQKINWDQATIDLKILYVEDKIVNQKIVKVMLENIGCEVDIANNGQEGLDMITTKRYDLVFMDLQMPVMDGLTASRKLLELDNPPPVIAITANYEFLGTLDLSEYGIKDYISKPVKTEELYEKLLYWVQ